MSFTHKVVTITGGGTGMGKAVAQALLKRGALVVLNGRRADVLEATAREKDHIRVNTIAPAIVETPVFNSFLTEEQVAHVLPTFHALHPLGRNGQTHDIVAAVLFLASDEASWITGTILSVDGGVMAGRP